MTRQVHGMNDLAWLGLVVVILTLIAVFWVMAMLLMG
jgi:hypothetical protein